MKKIISIVVSLAMLISMSTSFALPLSAEGVLETTSEAVTTAPEESPALTEAVATLPEAEDIMQGTADPAPEVTEPLPEVTEPTPDITEPTPEVSEPEPADDFVPEDLPLAAAENVIAGGACGLNGGDNLTWALDNTGTLTVTGTGAMDNYTKSWDENPNVAPWSGYTDSITNVVIEEGVTSIGSYAFGRIYSIGSVSIPASVASINYDSFACCTGLTAITVDPANQNYRVAGNCLIENGTGKLLMAINNCSIPNDGTVKTLEMYSLSAITEPTDVVIPASVTKIVECALSYGNIRSIAVDSANTEYYVKNDCLIEKSTKTIVKGLGSSIIPDDGSVTTIGRSAFETIYFDNTDLVIPDAITSIGLNAFTLSNITSVFIPASVTSIGGTAFRNCSNLVTVFCKAESKPEGWDDNWIAGVTPMVIWGSSGDIGEFIAEGTCGENGGDNLTWTLDGAGTLTITGTGAMDNYTNQWYWPQPYSAPWHEYKSSIINVVIEDGVTSIGSYAFDVFEKLNSITIPASVSSIMPDSIVECHSLASIAVDSQNTYYRVENNCLIENSTSTLLSAYGSCSIPENGVSGIKTFALSSLSEDIDLVIPASVTEIMQRSLSYGRVMSITVDEGNTKYYIAGNCLIERDTGTIIKGYADSVIPADGSVTKIGDYAFRNEGMETITIPDGITEIGEEAFFNCYNLTSITIPKSVVKMEAAVFAYSNKLATIYCQARTRPEGWVDVWICWNEQITPEVVWNCDNEPLEPGEIVSSGSCGAEGDNLSWTYDSVGTLTITGTGAMDNYTGEWHWPTPHTAPWFEFRKNIVNVVIEDGVTSIGSYAFDTCDKLNSITIPASVSTIMPDAIIECHALTSIAVDSQSASYQVVNNCLIETGTSTLLSAYGSCSIPESGVSRIQTYAFSSLSNSVDLVIPASVTEIMQRAFSFGRVQSIMVAEGNTKYFMDGNCLIERDTKTLIKGFADSEIPADGSVTVIGTSAFRLEAMETIAIPDTIVTIRGDAFFGCYNLKSVVIPKSVTTMEAAVFAYSTKLETITCGAISKPSGWSDSWICYNGEVKAEVVWGKDGNPDDIIASGTCGDTTNGGDGSNLTWRLDGTGTLTISGQGRMDDYTRRYADYVRLAPWFDYRDMVVNTVIEEGVTSIGRNAFVHCTSMLSISIPASVESIWFNSFEQASALAEIKVAEGNAYYEVVNNCLIEKSSKSLFAAISGCSIPNDGRVKIIETFAFSTLSANTDVVIPSSVTIIAEQSLCWNKVRSITVESGNANYYMENNCLMERNTKTLIKGFSDSVIPADTEIIGVGAFRGTDLENAVIPSGVRSIGEDAFGGCNKLTSITIPRSVEYMSPAVFGYSLNLKTINCCVSAKPDGWHEKWLCWNDEISPEIIWGAPGEIIATGTCGDKSDGSDGSNLTWTLDSSGTLTISGQGRMANFTTKWEQNPNPNIVPWDAYQYGEVRIKKVVIEEGVTSIGNRAFENFYDIASVTIPDSVTSIGFSAFWYCGALTSLTIPNSVTFIDAMAFVGCSGLSTINLEPNNNYYHIKGNCLIETKTGKLIKGFNSSVIPDDGSIKSIESGAFSRCSDLTNIIIPDSVTFIGGNAFENCDSITSIAISSNVWMIGDNAFSYCNDLSTITVDPANKYYHVAGDCLIETATKKLIKGLDSSVIPDDGSVTSISYGAFSDCGGLTGIAIPSSVTSIRSNAFANCSSLTSIIIPNGVKSIEFGTFSFCTSLTSVTIPSSVASISTMAFSNCTSLKSIYIPASVTSMQSAVFAGCTGLTAIYCGAEKKPSGWDDNWIDWGTTSSISVTWGYKPDSEVVATGTCGDTSNGADGTNLTWTLDGAGTLTISGEGQMDNYGREWDSPQHLAPWTDVKDSITRVVVDEGVTSIGTNAFPYCTKIKSAEISSTVSSIAATAFDGCSSLNSIVVSDNSSFYCMRNNCLISKADKALIAVLNGFVIPDDGSVTRINNYAFSASYGPFDVIIPACVTVIEEHSLSHWNVVSVAVQEGSTSYRMEGNCLIGIKEKAIIKGFGDSVIPNDDSVTAIGGEAFSHTSIESIRIPDNITTIRSCAFSYCSQLTTAYIPESVTNMEGAIFFNSTNLKNVMCGAKSKPDGWYDDWLSWEVETNPTIVWGCVSDTDVIASGTCGEGDGKNLTWTFDNNGTLTISGTGRMDDYVPAAEDFAPWADYWKQIKKVVINDGVTSIGLHAFDFCTSIEEANIADSVVTIESYAFYDCRSLREIYIPKNVTSVRAAAFAYCYNLSTISVAPENKYYHVSGNCLIEIASKKIIASAVSCEIPDDGSVTSIETYAFAGNTSLTSIIIPSSVTSIADYAFSSCTKLTDITIPDSVTSIGWFTFNECSSLTDIYCEAESKPDSWADDWQGIQNYETGAQATVYWGYKPIENIIASGFCGGEEGGKNLTWTLSITGTLTISGKGIMIDFTITLPISTFALTREATELTVAPWSQYADKITNIVLDEGVTSIGSHAFDGCEEVKVVSIPKTIEVVGESAFDNCTSLKTIYCEAEKAPEGWDDSWQGVQDSETGEKAEVIWGKLEPKYEPGDVNGDGKLNNQDAIHLLKHVMNSAQYTINQSGDMNGDGKLNNQDAIYLLKHILNPSTYPLKN